MSDYQRLIDQLTDLAMTSNYLRYDIEVALTNIDNLRRSGYEFADMLMTIPIKSPEFLSWIGYLDIEIPQEFVDEFVEDIPWTTISSSVFAPINRDFAGRYAVHLDWDALCWGLRAGNEDLLRDHEDFVDWESLSWTPMPLSLEFLFEYADRLDWEGVFTKKKFTYPYGDMKSAREQTKEDLMSMLFSPDRISSWVLAGKEIEDYLP